MFPRVERVLGRDRLGELGQRLAARKQEIAGGASTRRPARAPTSRSRNRRGKAASSGHGRGKRAAGTKRAAPRTKKARRDRKTTTSRKRARGGRGR